MLATVHHKINLGLHIIEKLFSGYHAIETVFYPCHFFEDILEISHAERFSFALKKADFTGHQESNLCVKAYRLLQKKYDLPPVCITLTKQIPSGAGLGGGSANAAFTLKMLNQFFLLQLSEKQLHEYAALLGSDVPFFLYDTPMYATERGDVLEPIDLDLSKYRIEIVCTNISISTALAYSKVTPKKPNVCLKEIIKTPIEKWKNLLINDFEGVVFMQHPQISEIKQNFYNKGALYAAMSGSGSAVYGIFEK